MRLMGLDYGSRTVGVAVSDPNGVIAQPLETIERKEEDKLRRTLARIQELVQEYQVAELVLGYPRNMNHTEGERCEKVKAFQEMLIRRTGLPVILWDERLTTVAADRVLIESRVRREHRKEVVDQIAASLILQGYLENKENGIGKDSI